MSTHTDRRDTIARKIADAIAPLADGATLIEGGNVLKLNIDGVLLTVTVCIERPRR